MMTQFMASIPSAALRECVGTLEENQQEVSSALDMLFLGF